MEVLTLRPPTKASPSIEKSAGVGVLVVVLL